MIEFENKARDLIKEGIDTLANAVKVTLGPKGRNVVIQQQMGLPHITKDGVTVARAVNIPDNEFKNIGAQLIKEVASKTNDEAGDGTTTSTILAQAIYNGGLKYLNGDVNAYELKRGIDKAVKETVNYLLNISKEIKKEDIVNISNIAKVSSNNDVYLSDILSKLFSDIGADGIVTVEESRTSETFVEHTKGIQFERGYLSPYFLNQHTLKWEYDNCYILMINSKIEDINDIITYLDVCASRNSPLLIICDDIEYPVLSSLIMNSMENRLKVCVVKSPTIGQYRTEELEDIAVTVNGVVQTNKAYAEMGFANKVIVEKQKTTIIGGDGSSKAIESYIDHLNNILSSEDLSIHDKEKLKLRIAKLSNGVATLYISAKTEVEVKERIDRANDSVRAIKAALEEGVVSGGGSEYIRAAKILEKINDYTPTEALGKSIIIEALHEPLSQICRNAGVDSGAIKFQLNNDKSLGYNVLTDKVEDLISSGIMDPVKVSRVALENAASIAGLLLTTECVIVKD